MAEAYFNHFAGGKASASSAGTQPDSQINATVAQVMLEAGLDISHNTPRLLTLAMMQQADRVITMGCGAEKVCPAGIVPMEDWQLEDPEGKPIETVIQIRDTIRNKVTALIKELSPMEGPIRIERG